MKFNEAKGYLLQGFNIGLPEWLGHIGYDGEYFFINSWDGTKINISKNINFLKENYTYRNDWIIFK